MSKHITITMPDSFDDAETNDYVAHVADQIGQGFTSGHVGVGHFWDYGRGTKVQEQAAELAVLREDAAALWDVLAELVGACRQRDGRSLERIEEKAAKGLLILNARSYGNIEDYPGFVIYTGGNRE